MDGILDFLKLAVAVVAVILGVLAFIVGIMQLDYSISKSWDTSTGKVYCDGSLVYEGRLYRVHDYLRTENLQAPMFTVTITSPNNRFKTEKCYFCKDLKVVNNK